MKWNCYDLFDHYNTEKNGVPALKEQPIRTDAVLERVQAQTAAHSQPHKRSRIRMTKTAAARRWTATAKRQISGKKTGHITSISVSTAPTCRAKHWM